MTYDFTIYLAGSVTGLLYTVTARTEHDALTEVYQRMRDAGIGWEEVAAARVAVTVVRKERP